MTLNPAVAINAEPSPIISKDTSVTVAIPTPIIIGNRERYTLELYVSPINILDIITVKNGIVARNAKKNKKKYIIFFVRFRSQ